MKTSNRLLLAVALSSALLMTACNRGNDNDADDAAATAASADTTPAPATSAMPADSTVAPASGASVAPAASATTPVDSGLAFAAMDKNGDGGISKDELADTEMLYQHFSAADTDGDGKLSSAEVDTHRAEMAAKPGG
ncbi:EF-hand domain-containing protein [Cognatiluteimonas profundi]|uniref:EF-hand domain-containing protein n=1 Tax=Cognatiluteimonas profundi TaxID=2594501 RepID=UPI00131EABE9|nr:EF-hand domain-containing protein [Lysobacter profundi]